MATKNVETIQRAHKAFNDRKLEQCAGYFADDGGYHDTPRGVDFMGRDRFTEFMEGWITALSDCKITDAHYYDAGDTVIVEFQARGTNDGPLGKFPPTRRKVALPYCEVVKFDGQGKIKMITAYYDLLGFLGQLGHLQPPREVQPGVVQ